MASEHSLARTPLKGALNLKEGAMRIFVSNLAYTTTAHELRQLFAAYGVVDGGYILRDRTHSQGPGFGFVTMAQTHEAQAAITGLQGMILAGRTLVIHEARPRW